MDIFDTKNNFIVTIPKSNANFPAEYVKDTVFVATVSKGYKYYPPYSNLYAVGGGRGNIISLFDIFLDNDTNMKNENYSDKLYENLKKDFRLSKETYEEALQLYFDPKTNISKKIIKKIHDSEIDSNHRINSRILEFDDELLLGEACYEEENASTCKWSKTSSKKASSTGSVSEIIYDDDTDDDTDKSTDSITRDRDSGDFTVSIVSYELHISESLDADINLRKLYDEITPDEKIISTGMVIDGESTFKKIDTEDKATKRYLKEFMDSEHVSSRKYLKPDIFHFLYDTKQGIIFGEVKQRGNIKLKVKPKKVYLSNFDGNIKDMKSIAGEIYDIVDKLIKMKRKDNVQPYNISFKAVYEDGYMPIETVEQIYKGKIDRGIFVRFDIKLKGGNTVKNILYSKKNDSINYTVSGISPSDIEEVLKSFQYFISHNKQSIIPGKKKEIKKQDIKTLEGAGIVTDSRECPKDRRPFILENPSTDVQSMKYSGKTGEIILGCKNMEYKYPGYTKKNRLPCCFKRSQQKKSTIYEKTTDCLQKEETKHKILNKRALAKDNVIMDILQRGRFTNRVLLDIFHDKDYYSLSVGIDKSLEDCLKFAYCDTVVEEAISNMSEEIYTKYEISSEPFDVWVDLKDKSIESIVKSVSFYKKVNPLVIYQEERGTKITCSMTNFFLYDKYIIFIGRNNDYKILIKTPDDKSVIFEILHDDLHVQKLIDVYNSYCSATDCNKKIPKLQEIMKDPGITIENQVVNFAKRVYYVETREYGTLPISASSMDKTLNSKIIKDITLLSDSDQYDKLKEASIKYKYLTPIKMVMSKGDDSIKGIEIECGMVVPVIISAPSIKLPESEINFYIDLDDAIKSEIISGEELRIFKENIEDSYVNIATTVISEYLTDNIDKKTKIEQYINDQDYDKVIEFIVGITTKEEIEISKETLPIEGVIPFKISSDVYEDVVSRLAWVIINDNIGFFNAKSPGIKTKFISNPSETEINISTASI